MGVFDSRYFDINYFEDGVVEAFGGPKYEPVIEPIIPFYRHLSKEIVVSAPLRVDIGFNRRIYKSIRRLVSLDEDFNPKIFKYTSMTIVPSFPIEKHISYESLLDSKPVVFSTEELDEMREIYRQFMFYKTFRDNRF